MEKTEAIQNVFLEIGKAYDDGNLRSYIREHFKDLDDVRTSGNRVDLVTQSISFDTEYGRMELRTGLIAERLAGGGVCQSSVDEIEFNGVTVAEPSHPGESVVDKIFSEIEKMKGLNIEPTYNEWYREIGKYIEYEGGITLDMEKAYASYIADWTPSKADIDRIFKNCVDWKAFEEDMKELPANIGRDEMFLQIDDGTDKNKLLNLGSGKLYDMNFTPVLTRYSDGLRKSIDSIYESVHKRIALVNQINRGASNPHERIKISDLGKHSLESLTNRANSLVGNLSPTD